MNANPWTMKGPGDFDPPDSFGIEDTGYEADLLDALQPLRACINDAVAEPHASRLMRAIEDMCEREIIDHPLLPECDPDDRMDDAA